MSIVTRIVTLTIAIPVITGCNRPQESEPRAEQRMWFPRNVQGNWMLRDVNPPENASSFNIQAITFNPDQTYVARLLKEGNRLETARGTYRYDEWNRRLYLHSGPDQRNYGAFVWFGTELRLQGDGAQGFNGTAILARSNLRVIPDAAPVERRNR